jgi:hypothetical protein
MAVGIAGDISSLLTIAKKTSPSQTAYAFSNLVFYYNKRIPPICFESSLLSLIL